MKRNKFYKIIGAITAIVAVCTSALSCHLISKNTNESKNINKKNNDNQNVIKEKPVKENYIEIINMYGIPMQEDTIQQTGSEDDNDPVVIIEKYAIPFIPDKEVRVLKYAVPKEISPAEKNVKKYAVPNLNIAKYAVPDINIKPVLKYALPQNMNDNQNNDNTERKSFTDSNGNEIYLPMYALPKPEFDKNK